MSKTSAALRESIRQGLIGAHVDRAEFEWAVAEVYRLEHEEEALTRPCARDPGTTSLVEITGNVAHGSGEE
jgi:hypothetical protein